MRGKVEEKAWKAALDLCLLLSETVGFTTQRGNLLAARKERDLHKGGGGGEEGNNDSGVIDVL